MAISPWEHPEKQQQYLNWGCQLSKLWPHHSITAFPSWHPRAAVAAARPRRAIIYPSHSPDVPSSLGTFQLLFPPASFLTLIPPLRLQQGPVAIMKWPWCHRAGVPRPPAHSVPGSTLHPFPLIRDKHTCCLPCLLILLSAGPSVAKWISHPVTGWKLGTHQLNLSVIQTAELSPLEKTCTKPYALLEFSSFLSILRTLRAM